MKKQLQEQLALQDKMNEPTTEEAKAQENNDEASEDSEEGDELYLKSNDNKYPKISEYKGLIALISSIQKSHQFINPLDDDSNLKLSKFIEVGKAKTALE